MHSKHKSMRPREHTTNAFSLIAHFNREQTRHNNREKFGTYFFKTPDHVSAVKKNFVFSKRVNTRANTSPSKRINGFQ